MNFAQLVAALVERPIRDEGGDVDFLRREVMIYRSQPLPHRSNRHMLHHQSIEIEVPADDTDESMASMLTFGSRISADPSLGTRTTFTQDARGLSVPNMALRSHNRTDTDSCNMSWSRASRADGDMLSAKASSVHTTFTNSVIRSVHSEGTALSNGSLLNASSLGTIDSRRSSATIETIRSIWSEWGHASSHYGSRMESDRRPKTGPGGDGEGCQPDPLDTSVRLAQPGLMEDRADQLSRDLRTLELEKELLQESYRNQKKLLAHYTKSLNEAEGSYDSQRTAKLQELVLRYAKSFTCVETELKILKDKITEVRFGIDYAAISRGAIARRYS